MSENSFDHINPNIKKYCEPFEDQVNRLLKEYETMLENEFNLTAEYYDDIIYGKLDKKVIGKIIKDDCDYYNYIVHKLWTNRYVYIIWATEEADMLLSIPLTPPLEN